MEIMTREKLNDLMQRSGHSLISLYIPTHRLGRDIQQDSVRLKNMLTKAREQLETSGLRNPEIEKLLRPAESLLLDTLFWQHQSDGLALFIATDYIRYYRLPANFDEFFIIGERFYLKPLLPLLSKNGHFYVLALSQKQVRLLEGSLYSLDEIDLVDMPTGMREALVFDDPERQLQFHTGTSTPGRGGVRPAIFHGQGVSEQNAKTDLLRYFQQVDKGLMAMLGDERSPLVLAGVDYLLPIYQQANNYPNLVKEGIIGNPDDLPPTQMHKQAWKIVEPILNTDQLEAVLQYQELSGSGSKMASNSINSIIPAAHYGRVDTLFVTLDAQVWGNFDASKNVLEQHQNFHPSDQDLLDLAAVQTLLNSGVVYALENSMMPDDGPLAAIFRYTYQE